MSFGFFSKFEGSTAVVAAAGSVNSGQHASMSSRFTTMFTYSKSALLFLSRRIARLYSQSQSSKASVGSIGQSGVIFGWIVGGSSPGLAIVGGFSPGARRRSDQAEIGSGLVFA